MTAEAVAARRRRVLERQAAARLHRDLPASLTSGVVGVSFCPAYPDSLHRLEAAAAVALWRGEATAIEAIPAILRRNPRNEHDPNAVEVHVPMLGEAGHIGHLPAALAARFAPELDAGVRWRAEVIEVIVRDDAPHRPGIKVGLSRVDALVERFVIAPPSPPPTCWGCEAPATVRCIETIYHPTHRTGECFSCDEHACIPYKDESGQLVVVPVDSVRRR